MTNFAPMIYNTGYEAILSGLMAAVIAQIIKFFLHLIVHRKVDFRVFTTTGGMPSSHSAGMVGLATSVGIVGGFSSLFFAVAIGNALVVMYDAAGIRRAAGKMAVCLNKIMDDFYNHDVSAIGPKLKELLGHTQFEVACGAILGIIFAYFLHYYLLTY